MERRPWSSPGNGFSHSSLSPLPVVMGERSHCFGSNISWRCLVLLCTKGQNIPTLGFLLLLVSFEVFPITASIPCSHPGWHQSRIKLQPNPGRKKIKNEKQVFFSRSFSQIFSLLGLPPHSSPGPTFSSCPAPGFVSQHFVGSGLQEQVLLFSPVPFYTLPANLSALIPPPD